MKSGKYWVIMAGRGRVTIIIGKNIALSTVNYQYFITIVVFHSPQSRESNDHEHSQNSYSPVLSLLIDLDQTVQKGCEPQEPFQEGCEHDRPHNRDIDDLAQPLA